MLSLDQAIDRAADLVARARTAGADAADAVYSGSASIDIGIRLGKLEDAGRSEGEEIGLRVFVGGRSASVSSSDLSAAALDALAERAIAMAREAPEDPWAGLAPAERLMTDTLPDLDICDSNEPPPATLKALALEAEDAARSVRGVTNSEGAGASFGNGGFALATSTGFARGYRGTHASLYASVLAGEPGAQERDHDAHSARFFADLESPEAIGRRAGERAVARLNPGKIASGPMPVVFDPRISGGMISHLLGAISGSAIARRTSFLLDRLGEQIFAAGITIIDDPLRLRGLRSRPFDGEGLPTAATTLVDKGVLTQWLMDTASARQLGLAPTGHAARGVSGPPGVSASNTHIAAGTQSREHMIGAITRGLYVTQMFGSGVNPVTGDYSRGASGFLIENGALTTPVSEITIAGNLKEMFLHLHAADDLAFRYASNAPTLMVEQMMVAGD